MLTLLPNVRVAHTEGLRNTDSMFVLTNIEAVIHEHDVTIDDEVISVEIDCLVSVCLGCSSIIMAATPEDRDMHAEWTDTTCHANQTYVLTSV